MNIGTTAVILIAVAGTFIIVTLVLMACIMCKKIKNVRYPSDVERGNRETLNDDEASMFFEDDTLPICQTTLNNKEESLSTNNNLSPFDGENADTITRVESLDGSSGDSDTFDDNNSVAIDTCVLHLPRMKKSHSIGCYAITSCNKGDTPYMRCPVEDVSENIPPYHFNESILKEQALCSSYTKLKAVYDVQSETLRRTNSSPPIRTTRFTNSHTGCPINNIPEVLHPLNQDEYNEGYDRAKFLYDRICKQLPAITTNTSEEEPTTYV